MTDDTARRQGNLSIRDRNVIHALQGHENADDCEAIYLRWKDRDWLRAEAAAHDWGQIGPTIEHLYALGAEVLRDQQPHAPECPMGEVMRFTRERVEREFFPQKGKRP